MELLQARGISTLLPSEQARRGVARRRAIWRRHQGQIATDRLVFIDHRLRAGIGWLNS
jgi:hypothetical protein